MFFRLSSLELAALVIGATLAATAIGHLAGRSLRRRTADLHEPVGVVQTALLGFVGLILAFGLALAVGRYDDSPQQLRRRRGERDRDDLPAGADAGRADAEPFARAADRLHGHGHSPRGRRSRQHGRKARARGRPDASARALGPRRPVARRRPDRQRPAAVRRDPQQHDRSADRAQSGPEQPGAAGGALVRAGERHAARSALLAFYLALLDRSVWTVLLAAGLVSFLLLITFDLDRPRRGLITVPGDAADRSPRVDEPASRRVRALTVSLRV